MFFLLALISMFGYALQSALLVRYARSIDSFSLSFYRNISFAITLLPLLMLSSRETIVAVTMQWPTLLLAGVSGALAISLRFFSYNYVPVSVSHSFTKVAVTVLLILMGWILLQEHLRWETLAIIGMLLFATAWLGMQRNHMPHLNNRTLQGIGLSVLASFPLACSVFLHVRLSKNYDPYASSYFWEVSIGLATVALIAGRQILTGKTIEHVSLRTFFAIAAASFPTLLGTAGLALAVRYGSLGVLSAINSTSLVVTALLAWWWYGETLKRGQWYAIGIIVLGVAGLKFV